MYMHSVSSSVISDLKGVIGGEFNSMDSFGQFWYGMVNFCILRL